MNNKTFSYSYIHRNDIACSSSYNFKSIEDLVYSFITTCKLDFAVLRAYYHAILDLMPDDYEMTVRKLQDYITDDQICAILSASNSTLANKMIIDCLIKRISCNEELLDLCDQLEIISTSHGLRIVTNEIRNG